MMTIAAAPARAQDLGPPPPEARDSGSIDQVIYKGVVGNLLEAVPLPAEQRVQLQRGNALISSTLTGRSLAVLLGLASPILMIGGLVWGIWSAANIKAPSAEQSAAAPATDSAQSVQAAAVEEIQPAAAGVEGTEDPGRLARTE